MKNEINNPMERFISKEETYFYGDGGVSDCDDCCDTETITHGHTGKFICSHCEGEFSVNEQNYVDPENTVCNACYAEINSYFVCSKCGYYCPCSFESAEEGVCKNCYVPHEPDPDNTESPKDDTTDTPSGGTTDVPTDNEGTEPPENEDQYGDGGTGFYCAECGEYCPCDMRCIDKDGREICMVCYRNPPVKFECDYCHNKFPVTEKHCVGDMNICNSCYESLPVCPICEERIAKSDKYSEDCDWCKNCAEGFSIKNFGEDSIEKGSTTTLIATVSTSDGTVELPVTWSTTTLDIISVDENGTVTGLTEGNGVVVATVAGCICKEYSIKVTDSAEYLDENKTIKLGEDVYIISFCGNSHSLIGNDNGVKYSNTGLASEKLWQIQKNDGKYVIKHVASNKYLSRCNDNSLTLNENYNDVQCVEIYQNGGIFNILFSDNKYLSIDLGSNKVHTISAPNDTTEWKICPTTMVRLGFDYGYPISSVMNRWADNANCEFVGRYLATDERKLTPNEADMLHANKKIISYFQMSEAKEDFDSAFSISKTANHASKAIDLATAIGQPENSAIFFCVDYVNLTDSQLVVIKDYFEKIHEYFSIPTNNPKSYKVGIYGNGTVCNLIKQESGYAEYSVLMGSSSCDGFDTYLDPDKYDIRQFATSTVYFENSSFQVDSLISYKAYAGEW